MSLAYNLTVAQPALRSVYPTAEAPFHPETIRENLSKVCTLVERAAREHEARLVAFPEFCLQGYTLKRSIADWERAGILMPGPETAELAKVARATGATIAGAVYERIPAFPGRYFMTGFAIVPGGATPEDQLRLVYRKLYAVSHKTRPGDMHDAFVARFGADSLFPVIDTALGKIGCAIAGDIAMPEMTRALALRGAEIVFVPTAAGYAPGYASRSEAPHEALGPAMSMVRRVRAWENVLYLAAPNIAPFVGSDAMGPDDFVRSEIVDYLGRVIARADTGHETLVTARIDVDALRRHRADGRFNYLTHLQPALHAPDYATRRASPLNAFAAAPLADDKAFGAFLDRTWREMVATGVYKGAAD
jgi:predicted amidohydrolase